MALTVATAGARLVAHLALWTALAAAILGPTRAGAELRLDVTPAAVTAPERALVILEASSLHWAVHLLYEDGVEQRTVQVTYAAGLRDRLDDYHALFEDSDARTPQYLTDSTQTVLRIANGVRLRDSAYELSRGFGKRFPTPLLQYTVRMNSRDARALRLLLEKQAQVWGTRFGVHGFNTAGRVAFAEALHYTRLWQSASNQALPWEQHGLPRLDGETPVQQGGITGRQNTPLVPSVDIDGVAHGTPLGYLFAAMLTGERRYAEAREANGVVGVGALAGCSLPDAFSVREDSLISGDIEGILSNLIDGTRSGSAVAPYQILMKRAEDFDNPARAILRFARDLPLDGVSFLNQALWENPLVVEAFVLGHVDPAVVPIWRCMGLRATRNVVEPARSIIARNVAYDAIDRDLMGRPWNALVDGRLQALERNKQDAGTPRFFAAAHHVTRLLGVGLVDAVDLYADSKAMAAGLSGWSFDTRCTGWKDATVPEFIPREAERRFLRDMNFELYRNINIPVVQELKRTGTLFDPVTWGPLNASSAEDADFEFDLRMVLVEQGHIEDAMSERPDYGLDADGAYDRLTNSQLALYCSRIGPLARALNVEPNAQFQVLGDLHSMLERLKREGILTLDQLGFRSYIWRVATGSAYVHILHRKSQDNFVDYMRLLITQAAAQPPRKERVSAAHARELRALAERPVTADAALVELWTEGLATYLAPRNDSLSLFDCISDAPQPRLAITPVTLPLQRRAARVQSLLQDSARGAPRAMNGLSPVVIAFELSASGAGALVPNAALDADPANRAAACNAIAEKRAALDGLMRAGRLMPFLYGADDTTFMVMERSLKLAETQATLEPFLLEKLEDTARTRVGKLDAFTRDDVRRMVKESLEAAAAYERDQALALRLVSMKGLALEHVGVSENRDALKAAALGASLTAAIDKTGDAPLADRMNRVKAHRDVLRQVRLSVCGALSICGSGTPDAREARPAPIRPIRVEHVYPDLTEDDVIHGLGSSASLPRGASLRPSDNVTTGALPGSGLFYQVTPTGETAVDGAPVYEAQLTYRLPLLSGGMVAISTAGPQADADALALPQLDGLEALPSYRDLPLGIVFKATRPDPDTGKLKVVPRVRQDIVIQDSKFVAAARSLGVPGFIEIRGVFSSRHASGPSGIKNLDNITVYLDVALLGEPLEERVALPLVTDCQFVDPARALREALIAHVESAASTVLADLAAKVGTARLPADRAMYDAAALRFGPIRDRAIDIALDWESETITARLGYALKVGALEVAAIADLLVNGSGKIDVQALSFVTEVEDLLPALRGIDGVDALVTALEELSGTAITRDREVDVVLQRLQVYPVIRGNQVRLEMHHGIVLPVGENRCTLSLQAEAPLDVDEAFAAIQAAVQDDLAAQVAGCATQVASPALAQTLDDFLGKPELSLFGTQARIRITQGRDAARAVVADTGLLSIELELDQTGTGCESPFIGTITGAALRFSADRGSAWLELSDLGQEGSAMLSTAIICQVDALMPEAIKGYVKVDAVQVLGPSVLVDASIRGLPILSDVRLERINLSDPGAGLEVLRSALKEAASDALSVRLSAALKDVFGNAPIDLAGIGGFRFDAVRLSNSATPWWIELEGTLSIDRFSFPNTIVRIPVGGALSDLDVRIDGGAEEALSKELKNALAASLLSAIPNAPTITDLYFGRLNPAGTLYGFRFGAQVGFPLGNNNIDLEIRQAELSSDGLSLGGEITAALPTPLYFGPVALSQVLLTIVTGEVAGTRPGLKLGADLTAVDPQFARVLKLRSQLDLSDIDRLAFSLRSDVIALDSVGLMWAEGTADLGNAYARFDAEATGLVKDIVDPQLRGEINGQTGLVYAESKLEVLDVELHRADLELCSKECEVNGVPGEARMEIDQPMLLGQATGGARTDLGFSDPKLDAGIVLDLFSWRPGGARFALDLGGAELNLHFLGISVTLLTPTYQTMSPGFVARVLQDLLKIDLSELLKKPPEDITISLMTPSGGVRTTKQAETDSEDDPQPSGSPAADSAAQDQTATDTPPPDGGGPPPEEGGPPPGKHETPPRPDAVAPKQQTWGQAVAARVCERYLGPADASAIEPDPDHFYFVYGFRADQEPRAAWLWRPWSGDLPDWYTWPGFAGPAASKICKAPAAEAYRFEIPKNIVSLGAARSLQGWQTTCNADDSANSRVIPLDPDNADAAPRFQEAGLPLLCFDHDGTRVRVDSRLYFDKDDGELVLVPLCPPTTVDKLPQVRDSAAFKTLCRNHDDPIIRFPVAQTTFDFSSEVRVIGAREELRFYEQEVLPKVLGVGSPGKTGDLWQAEGIVFTVQPDEVQAGGKTLRVNILIETTGDNAALETRRLEPTKPDGSPSLMFRLYERARNDADWRGIFLLLYSDYLKDGELDPDFVTEDLTGSDVLVLRDRKRDRKRDSEPERDSMPLTALRWIWRDGTTIKEQYSFVPGRLLTLDGPVRYDAATLRALADLQKPYVLAAPDDSAPLRLAFGLSDGRSLQFRLLFRDVSCADSISAQSCPDGVGHVPDDTMVRVAVSQPEARADLAAWVGYEAEWRCATQSALREGLGQALKLELPASTKVLNRLFFDLDALTAETRNFNQEPSLALQRLGKCP